MPPKKKKGKKKNPTKQHEHQDIWLQAPRQFSRTAEFMFKKADINKSGVIEKKEAAALITALFEASNLPPPNQAQVEADFNILDTNHDKKVSMDEWKEGLRAVVEKEREKLEEEKEEEARHAAERAATEARIAARQAEREAKRQAEEERQRKRKEEEKALADAALVKDADGVRHADIKYLEQVLAAIQAEGKTPLILDSAPGARVNTFYTYGNFVMILAKGLFVNIRIQKKDETEVLDKARGSVVTALKMGYTCVVNMEDGATDFTDEGFNKPGLFPAQELFTNSGKAFLEEKSWSTIVREHEKKQGMFIPRPEFNVVMLSYFTLEDYKEFLSQSIPMEKFGVVNILPPPDGR